MHSFVNVYFFVKSKPRSRFFVSDNKLGGLFFLIFKVGGGQSGRLIVFTVWTVKSLDAKSKRSPRLSKHSTTVNQLSLILVQRLRHFHPSLDNLYIWERITSEIGGNWRHISAGDEFNHVLCHTHADPFNCIPQVRNQVRRQPIYTFQDHLVLCTSLVFSDDNCSCKKNVS